MQIVINLLRGFAIGVANIIPGVSGGTVALMLGIYQRLLDAISAIGPQTIKAFAAGRAGIKSELERIDAAFLVSLGIGAGLAIVASARLMSYLLETHHDPTYGFFFGLVAASLVVPWRLVKRLAPGNVISCLVAIALVVGLTLAMSGEDRLQAAQKKALIKSATSATPADSTTPAGQTTKMSVSTDSSNILLFFVSGIVAICAMILPGISGSFMLLLIGVYFDILLCINERQIFMLAVFAAGAATGLLLFTRLLKYLLQRYADATMSFLLGLVLGSLYAIWPFKSFGMVAGRRVDVANIMPDSFAANEGLTLLAFALGLAVVIIFMVIESRQKRPSTSQTI
ncbi:MAG: hypothetical protein CVV41_05485 [Candidatus Riflebacteria bacterium HGW-Riflebacteria-1]|jgi:putative membrane protein|nr:MAG: hypothetical protein CVV41_05485 [Candidatus Riflebacteria bacterium HGW-Riflebacteria-1]